MMTLQARSMLRAAITVIALMGLYELAHAKTLPVPPKPPAVAHHQEQADNSGPQCGPADKVFLGLSEKFNESPVWSGDAPDGSSIVVTESPKGKTWTLLMESGDGTVACIINSGASGNVGREGYVV